MWSTTVAPPPVGQPIEVDPPRPVATRSVCAFWRAGTQPRRHRDERP